MFFHLLNRGFEKRKLFFSKEDYLRFTHNLQDFNNKEIAFASYKKRRRRSEVSPPTETNKIVDALCWSLLPNHFHIMAQERVRHGASKFVQKVTGGYIMYLNPRHRRSGTIYQGRSKVIPVTKDAHFLHLPFYIIANPLDLFQHNWRDKGITDVKEAVKFLETYPWSAFPDLAGKKNFPEIVNRDLFFELFSTNEKRIKKDFAEWLADYRKNPDHPKLFLP